LFLRTLVPARQVWGGNPVEYIRDVEESEHYANYTLSYNMSVLGTDYFERFTPWSYNYLKIEATRDDVEGDPSELLASNYYWSVEMLRNIIYTNYSIEFKASL
jgi:hypothetical protein